MISVRKTQEDMYLSKGYTVHFQIAQFIDTLAQEERSVKHIHLHKEGKITMASRCTCLQ